MRRRRFFYNFEARHEPILSRRAFARRLTGFVGIASLVVGPSLFIGMIGYRFLESASWIDAFTDAAMILSGMGPITPAETTIGKLFASFYALYSGLVFIVVAGLILAPIVHRILHYFHLEG